MALSFANPFLTILSILKAGVASTVGKLLKKNKTVFEMTHLAFFINDKNQSIGMNNST